MFHDIELIMLSRICPICNNNIFHPNLHALKQAQKRNLPCNKCKALDKKPKLFHVTCNICLTVSSYTSNLNIEKRKCRSCSTKKYHSNNPQRFAGKNNPMFGKSCYSIWNEKLSEIEYNNKVCNLSKLKSNNATGSNNHQFGKPSALNSGRGISGKYKNLHFRSLLELAFLEKYEIDNQCLPESAENRKYMVSLDNGHNYFPDFVDNSFIYEIKPSTLINSLENILKSTHATVKFGDKYKIITEKDLPNYKNISKRLKDFDALYLNKDIPFN